MLNSTKVTRKNVGRNIGGNVGKTKCGNCGKTGHNKRTCGAPAPQQSPLKKRPSMKKPQEVEGLTHRNIVMRWDEHLETLNKDTTVHNGEGNENTDSDKTGNAEGETKGYTLEEMETLWLLKNGQDGKMGKGKSKYWGHNKVWTDEDNENLFEFIQDVESTPHGASTKVWHKFFKGLGATAKEQLLTKYAEDFSYYKQPGMTAGMMHYIKLRMEDNETKPQLPMKLFPVFAKDPSLSVRSALAERDGIPIEVRKILVEDKKMRVVSAALQSTSTLSETLEYAESRTEPEHPQAFQKGTRHWSYYNEVSGMRDIIASNPNITEKLFTKYADETFGERSSIQVSLFSNLAIPDTAIHKHYWSAVNKLEIVDAELSTVERKIETDTNAGKYPPYQHPLSRKAVQLKQIKRCLTSKSHNILSSGRAPLQVTLNALDENVKKIENNQDSSEAWQAEYRASLLLSKAQGLTAENFKKYSDTFLKHEKVEAMTGLVKNPEVPPFVVEKIHKWSEEKLNSGTEQVYKVRNLRDEANKKLKGIT